VDNQSPPILLWPNCSWKSFNFVGSYSALKKELIAHFSVFLANCLGAGPNFEGQKMQILSFSLHHQKDQSLKSELMKNGGKTSMVG
jgi:hypothetical protein